MAAVKEFKKAQAVTLTIEKIPRKAVKSVELDSSIIETADKAAKVLGYKVLKSAVSQMRLTNVLAELEIGILARTVVEQYKKQVIAKLRASQDDEDTFLQWEKFSIQRYDKPIPEFVLNKAIEIRERIPLVQFEVEELTENPVNNDPFLIARLGAESYYIEVWHEPSFESALLCERTGGRYAPSEEDDE